MVGQPTIQTLWPAGGDFGRNWGYFPHASELAGKRKDDPQQKVQSLMKN